MRRAQAPPTPTLTPMSAKSPVVARMTKIGRGRLPIRRRGRRRDDDDDDDDDDKDDDDKDDDDKDDDDKDDDDNDDDKDDDVSESPTTGGGRFSLVRRAQSSPRLVRMASRLARVGRKSGRRRLRRDDDDVDDNDDDDDGHIGDVRGDDVVVDDGDVHCGGGDDQDENEDVDHVNVGTNDDGDDESNDGNEDEVDNNGDEDDDDEEEVAAAAAAAAFARELEGLASSSSREDFSDRDTPRTTYEHVAAGGDCDDDDDDDEGHEDDCDSRSSSSGSAASDPDYYRRDYFTTAVDAAAPSEDEMPHRRPEEEETAREAPTTTTTTTPSPEEGGRDVSDGVVVAQNEGDPASSSASVGSHPQVSGGRGRRARTTSPSKAAAAAVAVAPTLRNVVRENRRLRAKRDGMARLLGVAASRFREYESGTARRVRELEEENRRLTELLSSSSSYSSSVVNGWRGAMMAVDSTTADGEREVGLIGDVVATLLRGRQSDSDGDSDDEEIPALLPPETDAWEADRPSSGRRLDPSSAGSGGEAKNVFQLRRKKREVRQLKRELEAALGDILMLTEALEHNNVALDSVVLELDSRQRRRGGRGRGGIAAAAASAIAEVDSLGRKLREREDEVARLRWELGGVTSGTADPSASGDAAERRYDDLRRKFDDLAVEADATKNDVVVAGERIAKLELELESRGGEIDRLRRAAEMSAVPAAAAAPGRDVDPKSAGEKIAADVPQSSSRGGNLGFLLAAKEPTDYQEMLRKRDLKIKSLEAVVHSSLRIMDKMKLDIERMDTEREEAEGFSAQKIEKLLEENKTYEMQVAGFELAFRNLNDQRLSATSISKPSHGDDEIVDDDVNMWDDHYDGEDKDEEADLRSKNLALQRMIEELQSSGSFQEDQIETLKAELVRLRVQSQQDKECALAQLSEENEIIAAQRSALEDQLIEINKSAGVLRHSLLSRAGPHSPGNSDEVVGSDPVLVAQVVMLENANKVLEGSVSSLRSDMQENIAPLLYRIAMLEEEKRIVKDEMNTKLRCRETTISNLENSLSQYRALQQAKKNRLKKKGGKNDDEK